MPHTDRRKCVACDRTIRDPRIHFLHTNLLRIFVSIEQRKRVTADDAICNSCRSKYYQWKNLTKGDFDHFDAIDSNYSESDDGDVDENEDMVIQFCFGYSI